MWVSLRSQEVRMHVLLLCVCVQIILSASVMCGKIRIHDPFFMQTNVVRPRRTGVFPSKDRKLFLQYLESEAKHKTLLTSCCFPRLSASVTPQWTGQWGTCKLRWSATWRMRGGASGFVAESRWSSPEPPMRGKVASSTHSVREPRKPTLTRTRWRD